MILFSVILLVIGIILLSVGVFAENPLASSIGGVLITAAIFLIGLYQEQQDTPSALDVYRGNTTLEITYRDSIPVDSVVVFKKK